MPSTPQDRPKITFYPSSQEEASAYMAAIRLASAVRNSMDAQKASADGKGGVIDDDSSGRHDPNAKGPAPANSTAPKAFPTLNLTSSAPFAANVSKPGFFGTQDSYPPLTNSTDTAKTPIGAAPEAEEEHHDHVPPSTAPTQIDAEDSAADASTGVVTIEALEEHHGRFPPPEPPIGATLTLPPQPVSGRAVPMPIQISSDTLRAKLEVPNGIPPQCQLYATNTAIHTPFAICPVTKRNSDLTHDPASRQLHSRDAPHSHILAIRNTVACEAPTDFHQRLVCGQYKGVFVLGVFILLSIIVCLVQILKVRKQRAQRLDEENRAKDIMDVLKAHQDWHHVGGKFVTEQYRPGAWRSSSCRAARATIGEKVEHDAGPVAELPGIQIPREV